MGGMLGGRDSMSGVLGGRNSIIGVLGGWNGIVMIHLFLFFHLFTSCALSHDPQSVSLSIAAQCLKVTTCCCATPHL